MKYFSYTYLLDNVEENFFEVPNTEEEIKIARLLLQEQNIFIIFLLCCMHRRSSGKKNSVL
jgi:hypothetical protein